MRRISDCPACGSANAHVVVRADATQRQRFIDFSERKYGGVMSQWPQELELVVLRCCQCGHHWYRDQPDERQLAQMYDAATSFYGLTTVDRDPTRQMSKELRRLRRLLTPDKPSLLDYGSGHGRWARAAVAVGFEVVAYEPSVVRGAEERPLFELIHNVRSLDQRAFDVINLEQVLEHVPDPVALLRQLKSFCRAGSIVRITVPNIDRPHEGAYIWRQWPFSGDQIHTMAPFEHLHGFSVRSLRRAAERAGFRSLAPRRLFAHYPQTVVRQFASLLIPTLGQTLVFVELDR